MGAAQSTSASTTARRGPVRRKPLLAMAVGMAWRAWETVWDMAVAYHAARALPALPDLREHRGDASAVRSEDQRAGTRPVLEDDAAKALARAIAGLPRANHDDRSAEISIFAVEIHGAGETSVFLDGQRRDTGARPAGQAPAPRSGQGAGLVERDGGGRRARRREPQAEPGNPGTEQSKIQWSRLPARSKKPTVRSRVCSANPRGSAAALGAWASAIPTSAATAAATRRAVERQAAVVAP